MEIIKSTVHNCCVIELPKIHNRAGNITVLECKKSLVFNIKRIYYLYDVPGGESRGGHAHKNLEQYLIAASGCFDVVLDDGFEKKTITLNRPYLALHILPGIWRELQSFSSGAICLVLASQHYNESDYMRNYPEFLSFKRNEKIL